MPPRCRPSTSPGPGASNAGRSTSRNASSLSLRSGLSNTAATRRVPSCAPTSRSLRYTRANSARPSSTGSANGEHALRDLPRGGDEHHHDEARLQGEDLDVAQARGADGRRRDDGEQLGDAREGLGGLAQRVVDLAGRAVALEEQRRRALAPLRRDGVGVVPVAGVGGHPPRGGVRVRQHAHVLEVGEVVADGGGGHAEAELLAQVPGPDRCAERDVLLDDGPQDLLLPCRERQPTPLNAESETGARTVRLPRASPFASRGLYHCAGKPIQRRRGRRRTSRSRTAATSASGTRSPQRAASRKRSRARVGASSASSARGGDAATRAPPPRRTGRPRWSSAGRRRCSRRPGRGRGRDARASRPGCGAPCAPAGRSC